MRRHMFTWHAYKFSLSGALIVLPDLRSGCTGEGSADEFGNTDSGGSAEEQAALTGGTGALLVPCRGTQRRFSAKYLFGDV